MFNPISATADETRDFVLSELEKWKSDRSVADLIKHIESGATPKHVGTAVGSASEHPQYPTHYFELRAEHKNLKFYVIEGLPATE